MVELVAEVVERLLLCAKVGARWSSGVGFQLRVHALVTTVLWWCTGSMNSGKMPRRTHHADTGIAVPGCWWRTARRCRCGYAAAGRMLNTRMNTGLASATLVDDRA